MVYVASGYEGLKIFDVSNPAAPTIVGSYVTPSGAAGVYVVGQVVYVADIFELVVLDVTTPSAPTLLGNYSTAGATLEDVHVINNTAYLNVLAEGLVILDVTTPSSITRLGSYGLPITRFFLTASLVYIVHTQELCIVDVSNASAPVLKGHLRVRDTTNDVFVVGTTAYVANRKGLLVINVTTPAFPTLVGECDIPGTSLKVHVVGSAAYVAMHDKEYREAVVVIDVSTPTVPVVLGTYPTPHRAVQFVLFALGNFLYVFSPTLQVYWTIVTSVAGELHFTRDVAHACTRCVCCWFDGLPPR
eukprot:TRINITY_DN2097_c0_g3_i2.p2 TRINITY_DN2097_c0_g3~~TRINITY_DN2097_c0_g3_i2.p2  ORF type:complete len:342 (+),score=23.57 TRINITY_DN2097_c0_g3_i2:121-1026(+)